MISDLLKLPWLQIMLGLVILLVIYWLPSRLRYRLTDRYFQVVFLGLPIRWVRLENIEKVTTHHVRWAEHWWNVWRPFRRRLMICKRKGLFKNLVITPAFRYELRKEIEEAVQRVQAAKASPAEPAQKNH